MAEISKTASLSLANIYPGASQADSLLALARESGGEPPRSVDLDGIRLRSDRVAVAGGASFTAQVNTLRQAAANAAEAATTLDVADAALSKIASRLARIEQLAETGARTTVERADGSEYTPRELSAGDRAILEAELDNLRSEIDGIAGGASFNGTALLGGDPASPGDPLELSFRVGDGPRSKVTASLNPADTESLSAELAGASLSTEAGSEAALEAVGAAQDALGDIRAAVRGARAQVATVEAAAGEVSAIVEKAREIKVSPQASIDLSRLVADQVTREAGVSLVEGAEQILQTALLRASAVSTPGGGAPQRGGDGIEEFGGKTAAAPALSALATATTRTADAGKPE